MNMFNKLPYFVNLQEKKYKINVDFRNMISFENKIQDKNVSESEILEFGLRHFYLDFFNIENYQFLIRNTELYREACEKLLWFYKCGRENYHKIKSGNKGCLKSNEIYSYEYDDEYIWGAFFELYKIDLTTDKLHWWKFKAILNSLPENTKFEKIKSYRAYKGKDKEMLELKDYWKLPLPFKEQERLDRIYELLK
ncbi:MAG: hypothetical protein HFJ45_01675 [Clostridia bacterium]|nr:hypothetical protein [Clostridia bacterium]